MAPTLFISDLHLSPERPRAGRGVPRVRCAVRRARRRSAVYPAAICSTAWVGDDQLQRAARRGVAARCRPGVHAGIPLYLQHGNRDFLLGERFARATGATLLPEPSFTTCTARRR